MSLGVLSDWGESRQQHCSFKGNGYRNQSDPIDSVNPYYKESLRLWRTSFISVFGTSCSEANLSHRDTASMV